jgi:citrate lyase subunit beta / citryl-CoA lyase
MSETDTNRRVNPCAHARSFLFVPGNRPERFEKAINSGADAVILDLEDSVPLAEKARAREAIAGVWPRLVALGVPLVVRINAAGSAEGETDLVWLARLRNLAAVMLPKAESAEAMARVHKQTGGIPLLPIVESAAGFFALNDIAAAPGVVRLVVGHIDFMADTGLLCDQAETQLAPLRFAVAMATRVNGLSPAVDGVTVELGDTTKLQADTLRALRFGFAGKLCVHPNQIALVHAALAPTPEAIDWAKRVIAADAASGGAAVQLDGRMVDLPVVLRARHVLARSAAD